MSKASIEVEGLSKTEVELVKAFIVIFQGRSVKEIADAREAHNTLWQKATQQHKLLGIYQEKMAEFVEDAVASALNEIERNKTFHNIP